MTSSQGLQSTSPSKAAIQNSLLKILMSHAKSAAANLALYFSHVIRKQNLLSPSKWFQNSKWPSAMPKIKFVERLKYSHTWSIGTLSRCTAILSTCDQSIYCLNTALTVSFMISWRRSNVLKSLLLFQYFFLFLFNFFKVQFKYQIFYLNLIV